MWQTWLKSWIHRNIEGSDQVLEGGIIPALFADSTTVFIPKFSDADNNGRIVRSSEDLRPSTLCNCDCKILTPAICRGLHWYTMRCIRSSTPIERWDPLFAAKPQKNPKPKRMRIPNRNGETRIIPTYRNGCKNSEIVDDRVPEHRLTREFLSEDQTYKGHLQKTYWRSCTSCRKFWWLDYSRSQGPQRQLRISKQSSICSRGAGLGHPMDPNLSVQNKNFTGNSKKLAEVPGTREKLEVIYTDNSLEFGKACEDFSWNHWTSHHRSETNGIAERAVRRVKEGTSAVLLQSGLKESWWVVSMECYTYLRNVTGNLKSFTLTIPWNLARLVKNFPWIIERERRTDRKQKLRAVRGNKERTSAVLLQSGLGNEWWAASMECHCYLRNIQDLLSDGKTIWKAVRNAF